MVTKVPVEAQIVSAIVVGSSLWTVARLGVSYDNMNISAVTTVLASGQLEAVALELPGQESKGYPSLIAHPRAILTPDVAAYRGEVLEPISVGGDRFADGTPEGR
ncbi:MAG: hypothetical protein ACFFCW_22270 [Candidatus Hodarchaeota archaeon]